MDVSQDFIMAVIGAKEMEIIAQRMRIADLERQLAKLSKPVPVEGSADDGPVDRSGHVE